MIRVFTERYFQADYNFIFLLIVVIINNFKRFQIFRKVILVQCLNKYLSLKCYRSHMKSEIYLLDKKIGKMAKRLREKQKFL